MKINIRAYGLLIAFAVLTITNIFVQPAIQEEPQNEKPGENPIFRDTFMADPAPLVTGDTPYVYVSHDEAKGKEMFTMKEWLCYST